MHERRKAPPELPLVEVTRTVVERSDPQRIVTTVERRAITEEKEQLREVQAWLVGFTRRINRMSQPRRKDHDVE